MIPKTKRKIPFIMPSRWEDNPILGFSRIGTKRPTTKPRKNNRLPKNSKRLDCKCTLGEMLIVKGLSGWNKYSFFVNKVTKNTVNH